MHNIQFVILGDWNYRRLTYTFIRLQGVSCCGSNHQFQKSSRFIHHGTGLFTLISRYDRNQEKKHFPVKIKMQISRKTENLFDLSSIMYTNQRISNTRTTCCRAHFSFYYICLLHVPLKESKALFVCVETRLQPLTLP